MPDRSPEPQRPAFRALDVHRVDDGGRRGLVLTDPLGLVEGQVFVPEALLPIVGLFDGVQSVAEIAEAASDRIGQTVPEQVIRDLIRQLDEGLLLESPLFRTTLRRTAEHFARHSVRPARHAGSAGYPHDAAACAVTLAEIVPGAVSRPRPAPPSPAGIVAPHIDLARGAAGYRAAYGALGEREPADLYVIFGTGHGSPGAPVTGLAMDWRTPLGTATTDRAFVARVHAALGEADPLDVFLHRDEHSIEFQVLFLQHLLGDRPFEVAGFLTGQLPATSGDPGADPAGRALCDAFRDAAAASRKRVCFVAGADLAHLGPHFGDPEPVDAERLVDLRRAEDARLSHLEAGQPGRFHQSVAAANNPDRVCGAAPIYLAAALAGGPAHVLHYGQAVADDRSQVVSFCSAILSGSPTTSP